MIKAVSFRIGAGIRLPVFCQWLAAAFILLTLTGASASPQTPDVGAEEAVRAVADRMWEALGERDLATFRNICSDDWELYTAGGARFSAERLFEVHRENIRGFRLIPESFEVRLAGNIAWATSEATMRGERRGEAWGGDFLLTYVFEKRGEDWICVHTHESRKNP